MSKTWKIRGNIIRAPECFPLLPKRVSVKHAPVVKNGLLETRYTALCMAHRTMANPKGEALAGVYGASAADISTFVHATDASVGWFIDRHKVKPEKLEEALRNWGQSYRIDDNSFLLALEMRREDCMWYQPDFERFDAALIMFELWAMGVKRKSVKISYDTMGNPTIEFRWAYPGERKKHRRITYLDQDLTRPDAYSAYMRSISRRGAVDFFMQKASVECFLDADSYLGKWADAAKRFLLISPSVMGRDGESMEGTAANILLPNFIPINDVNDAYMPYFRFPKIGNRLTKYHWYMEYWKRLSD